MNETNKNLKTAGLIIALAVPVILVVYLLTSHKNNGSVTTATSTTDGIPRPVDVGPTMTFYKDGTYSVTGNYRSPGGAETLAVTLTIKNNVVTDATVTPQAERPVSVNFQNMFAAGYKTEVIGKNIADLKLGKVSGSSLTPKGFNDAVEQIKIEAKQS